MKFLIDADVPASLGMALRRQGHDVVDVRQLPGDPLQDPDLDRLAQRERRILISRDLGFANLLRYPTQKDYTRVVIRMHRVSPSQIVEAILNLLQQVPEAHLFGALIIVQPGRFRIYRP